MSVLPVYHVRAVPLKARRGRSIPGAGVSAGCEPPCVLEIPYARIENGLNCYPPFQPPIFHFPFMNITQDLDIVNPKDRQGFWYVDCLVFLRLVTQCS